MGAFSDARTPSPRCLAHSVNFTFGRANRDDRGLCEVFTARQGPARLGLRSRSGVVLVIRLLVNFVLHQDMGADMGSLFTLLVCRVIVPA